MLAPVNFEALYQQAMARSQAESQQAAAQGNGEAPAEG
jgi:preprotein translocase subunit SecB